VAGTQALRCGPQCRYVIARGGARDGNSYLQFCVRIFMQRLHKFADQHSLTLLFGYRIITANDSARPVRDLRNHWSSNKRSIAC
jgi:hypothetical protein